MDKGTIATLIYFLYALLETIGGILVYFLSLTLIRFKETPVITACSSLQQGLVKRCPCLRSFTPAPWAVWCHAQTVWGLIKHCGTEEYKRRDVVSAPDGVQLILDWKEGPNLPEDAPIIFILHGIGGGSDSRLARLLADAAAEQGWRAAVYNRRGHGESTLLPGPLVPVSLTPAKRSSFRLNANHAAVSLAAAAASAAAAAANAANKAANKAANAVQAASHAAAETAANLRRVWTGRDSPNDASPVSAPSSPLHPSSVRMAAALLEPADNDGPLTPPPPTPAPSPIPATAARTTATSIPASGSQTPATTAQAEDGQDASVVEWQPRKEVLRDVRVFPKHSDTDDMSVVASHLATTYPNAPKVALGFSQGSNVLVHYLGIHANDPPPFTAGISVSNAYDLVTGTRQLKKDWVTDALIAKPIKAVLRKELAAVKELCKARSLKIDLDAALKAQGIRDFDAALVVPAYGYADVDDYYSQQCSKDVLKDIKTPLLLLNNRDDPIIPSDLPDIAQHAATQNGALVHVCTERGGHLGWMHGWRGSPWVVSLMIQYTQAVVAAVKAGELQVHGDVAAAHVGSEEANSAGDSTGGERQSGGAGLGGYSTAPRTENGSGEGLCDHTSIDVHMRAGGEGEQQQDVQAESKWKGSVGAGGDAC